MSPPRFLPKGKAYACPHCGKPMTPDKHMDVMHCFDCWDSVDLWWDKTPVIIDVEIVEETKIELVTSKSGMFFNASLLLFGLTVAVLGVIDILWFCFTGKFLING